MDRKNHKTFSFLESLGLSAKEVTVYLASLEIGRATVSHIARKTGVNRTTVYAVLDSLSAKGLVAISGKEPKEEYLAEPPEKLISFLESKLQETEHKRQLIQKKISATAELLPELKSLRKSGDRPQVRFYDGKDGLKFVFDDTIENAGEDGIRSFGSYEDMARSLGPQYGGFIKRRVAKGVFGRGIYPKTQASLERKRRDKQEMRELVLLPVKGGPYPEIDVYGNRVMIASAEEKLGVIIESAGVATAMKKIFDLAWERAKQLEAEGEKR